MSQLESIIERSNNLIIDSGLAAMNALYPAEFQYNVISFEVTDSLGNTLDYFSFPINPSGITIKQPEVTNIKKTFGGVSVITNNSFVPKSVAINGTFGRNFKVISSRMTLSDLSSISSFGGSLINVFKSPKNTNYRYNEGLAKREFSKVVKNGFGCIKLLEFIINKGGDLDVSGKPNMLFFHNNAFGESWLVKPLIKTFTIVDTRNIYDYNIQLAVVAPSASVLSKERMNRSMIKSLTSPMIQKKTNEKVRSVAKLLSK